MKRITALRAGRNRAKRINVFLDNEFAFSLEAEVVAREGLQVGQILSDEQVVELAGSNHLHRCLDAAMRYLGYRPRSESELRERLRQRGFDGDTLEAAVARLKGQGLVDDEAFAQFWRDDRESFRPRSRWLVSLELRQRGVAGDVIDRVTGVIDDEESAYRAALSKARGLNGSDYQGFRCRLGGFLRRRGFSYGVINNIVERMWQDQAISSG